MLRGPHLTVFPGRVGHNPHVTAVTLTMTLTMPAPLNCISWRFQPFLQQEKLLIL